MFGSRNRERERARGEETQSIRKLFDRVCERNKPDLRFEYNFIAGQGNKQLKRRRGKGEGGIEKREEGIGCSQQGTGITRLSPAFSCCTCAFCYFSCAFSFRYIFFLFLPFFSRCYYCSLHALLLAFFNFDYHASLPSSLPLPLPVPYSALPASV